MIKHIVSVSSGCSSAVAAKRVIDIYGKENVSLVFADTGIEDDDNYRFLEDIERFFEVTISVLSAGYDPFTLADKMKIIPNSLHAPCTFHLKIKLMQKFVKEVQKDGYRVIMYIGMNLADAKPRAGLPEGRLSAPIENWGKLGVAVEYPLLWDTPDYDSVETVKSWGLVPPVMYSQGYTHANCGGRCVKQGQKDWRKTLIYHPDRFEETVQWENAMIAKGIGGGTRAIMKHNVNGVKLPYRLEEFREDHNREYGTNPKVVDMLDDMGDVCGVECGVAGYEYQEGD